ncbi:hypothetical protein BJ742DRAFT_819601 [Cladochytrium replicatum]|nr:hypothetical protein BJ742DRAFT_819601 [Cladochytrium replicatum]
MDDGKVEGEGAGGEYEKRIRIVVDRMTALQQKGREEASVDCAKDVAGLWTEVVDIVGSLQRERAESTTPVEADGWNSASGLVPSATTTTDQLLEDVVPYFLRYWSQTGAVHEDTFQTYVQLTRAHHTLNHLRDTQIFAFEDLDKHRRDLRDFDSQLQRLAEASTTPSTISQHTNALLQAKSQTCWRTYQQLYSDIDSISIELRPVYSRLVEIKRELEALMSRKHAHSFSLVEVQVLQDELREIDAARIDGAYVSKKGEIVQGQARVISHLEECYDDVHELLAARDAVSGENPLRAVYERLVSLKRKLEELNLSRRWPNGASNIIDFEGILHSIQMELGEIDNLRVDGKFLDPNDSSEVPAGQAVLHQLLHKCYRLVYKLQSDADSEPLVADELMGVYRQLDTLRRCLVELVRWKVQLSERELIPYQLKLAGIDNMRVDGKFLGSHGNVPEGQGVLHVLLNECFERMAEIKSHIESE